MMRKLIPFFIVFFCVGCTSEKNIELSQFIDKWDDAIKVADSSSRIALTQPVARLQEIKREVDSTVVSGKIKECKPLLVQYMNSKIDVYLSFMRQNEDDQIVIKSSAADVNLRAWQVCLMPAKEVAILNEQNEIKENHENIIKSMCFGIGYSAGESRPKEDVPNIERLIYNKIFVNDDQILTNLVKNIKKVKRVDLDESLKYLTEDNCFESFQNGFLQGHLQVPIENANVANKDITFAFANAMKKRMELKAEENELKITGIMPGPDPYAVIGGNVHKIGDVIRGYRISRIEDGFVELIDSQGNAVEKKFLGN